MSVSAPTQALIDAAVADIPITQGLLAKVAGDQTAIAGSQATLTADQTALKTASDKQLTDGVAALNALAAELNVPVGTVIGSPPAGQAAHLSGDPVSIAKARIARTLLSHPRVAYAHALGATWQQILQAILAGLPAIEQLIGTILGGFGKPTPAPAP